MNIVKNPAAAEEITQNTFVKAMTTKSEYEGSSSPYTWLCAIAKNQCYDYFRKNGRIAEAVEPEQEAVWGMLLLMQNELMETPLRSPPVL